MWMGLYYLMNVHVFNVSTLVFSHMYQGKFQQMKLAINNILSLGFKNSIPPVIYYCLFYYVWGNKPRSAVSEVYNSYLEDPPLDNIFNLFRSGIWISLWLYTSLFFISMYIMKSTFNFILTEPMNFPIESNTHMTIYDALSQRYQFCEYLGAQDLKIMSLSDPARRLQIFTLSQPGGHPKNWNNLLDQCLHIINDFSRQLDTLNHNEQQEIEVSNRNNILNARPHSDRSYDGIRNMAHSPELLHLKNHNKTPAEDSFAVIMEDECKNILNRICQMPGISFFFGELTDTKLKYLLVQAQPVVWVCEGLAFMAAASLKEDKYGVVQNDLAKVITALINLKQNLEKLTKPGLMSRKHVLNDAYAIKMRAALFSSVKRSIYKLVITFSGSICMKFH
ncbi:nucleoporin Ndc1 [Manduca sexta]|uniref:nucleoporin Ndc1 n=1 Tax=Manduca sexta TaxID=7130 RepID=UPI001890AD80|nr:nucleoporin Ndc1 [Manduca sexta]